MMGFDTHLPAMPRTEQIVLVAQIERALSTQFGGEWNTTTTTETSAASGTLRVAGVHPLSAMTCALEGNESHDAVLQVDFHELAPVTAATESLIGETMHTIHNVLMGVLDQPPTKMWMITSGRWTFGSRFNV